MLIDSYQNRRSEWAGEEIEPRVFTLKEGVWFCMMSLTPQGQLLLLFVVYTVVYKNQVSFNSISSLAT